MAAVARHYNLPNQIQFRNQYKKNPTKFERLETDRQTDNLSYDWPEIGKPTIIRDDIISIFSWDELVRDD